MENDFSLKNTRFLVPQEVYSDIYGYTFLANIASQSLLVRQSSIYVDFEECTFFEGNLCAILGNILQNLLERNNQVSIDNLSGTVRGAMSRNGFLPEFINSVVLPEGLNSTVLPYSRFKISEETKAMDFFTLELFTKENMPKMSALVQKEIIRNIFEVCLNALTHGECEYVYCCGQMHLRKNTQKVVITIADLGKTIKANVNNHLMNTHVNKKQRNLSGNQAITWALTEGNTTKNKNIPGGLGLKLLQGLVKENKGKLQFVSSDGFIEINNGIIENHKIDIDFPGTIVNIELLLKDPNFYILKSEENDWDGLF